VQRKVVALGFEAAVCETRRAIEQEGLQVIARIDDVWQDVRCVLFEAWSPELWQEVLQHSLAPAALILTTFTIYEVADGETAVEATEPFSEVPEWSPADPLAVCAHQERERAACVLERLRHPQPRKCS
jgi:hypothetical protein